MLPLVGLVGNRELMLVKHLSHFYFKNNVCYQHGNTVLELRVKALPSWVSTSLKWIIICTEINDTKNALLHMLLIFVMFQAFQIF